MGGGATHEGWRNPLVAQLEIFPATFAQLTRPDPTRLAPSLRRAVLFSSKQRLADGAAGAREASKKTLEALGYTVCTPNVCGT